MRVLLMVSAVALVAVGAASSADEWSRMPPPTLVDTSAASRDSMMNAVLLQIRGKEQLPAESVFRNITVFKGRPAGQIPRIMNLGYGRSLGVGCAHCHDIARWDTDDKAPKRIAREMAAMVTTINTQLLPKIPGLRGPQPIVNCTTCHMGTVKPALNLPGT